MGRRDWNRPRFRTSGRQTEDASGNDVPPEFRSAPRAPAQTKAELRAEGDRAVRQFQTRQKHRQPLRKVNIIPDGDESPF